MLLVAFVIAVVMVVPGILRTFDAPLGIDASELVTSAFSAGDWSQLDGMLFDDVVEAQQSLIPAGFEDELLEVSSLRSWSSSNGDVVGFVTSDDPDAALSAISDKLAAKGWTKVESGSDVVASFVKDHGCFGWCLVACQAMDSGSCVAIQVEER